MLRIVRGHLSTQAQRSVSTVAQATALSGIETVVCPLHLYSVSDFREQAFAPELPLLIASSGSSRSKTGAVSSIPAVQKWFHYTAYKSSDSGSSTLLDHHWDLNKEFFARYESLVLPYELIVPPKASKHSFQAFKDFMGRLHSCPERDLMFANLPEYIQNPESLSEQSRETFHAFYAPLSLMLAAARDMTKMGQSNMEHPLRCLYIAQAQLRDLPSDISADLPTPHLVLKAGRGDVYDSNLWMGTPPTYTPLHKDPNPNLFVQLCSIKTIHLFRPEVGRAIFHDVQRQLGASANASMRGEEMMGGPERILLDRAIWGDDAKDGFEVTVRPGDGLFIPKGWWHSIKSVGASFNASVNWWFR